MKNPNVVRLEKLADLNFGKTYPHSVKRVPASDMYEVAAYLPGFHRGVVYRIRAESLHTADERRFWVIAGDLAYMADQLDQRNLNGPFYTAMMRVMDDSAKALAKTTPYLWPMKVEGDGGGAKQW